jgi:hypothetical protein
MGGQVALNRCASSWKLLRQVATFGLLEGLFCIELSRSSAA